ncbi:hypothetical protein KR018_001077 [Drosophila ironensis]|nr:hypothetical protein KR018_001077 [Drosophila ironensis]
MGKDIPMATVAQHNKPNDLWMVIDNKVYDVTKFLKEHPGGEQALTNHAGKESTKAFNDVGHSRDARKLLKKFLVGNLASADRPKKYCKIGLAVGAALLGISLIYLIRRGLAKN